MKRILVILCIIILAFSLAACSTDISSSSSMASSSEEMIETTSRNVPSAEPAFQESTAASKALSSISEVSSANSVAMPPESTPEPVVPEPATPEPATPEPVVPEPVVPEPVVPEPVVPEPVVPEPAIPEPIVPEEDTMRSIQVTVGGKTFSATLAENDAANSFVQLLQSAPVVLQMSDYSGFEKVGYLGTSLPEGNRQITTQAGDIVLYNGNQICVFYGSNSWSYTRLGRIDDLSGWAEALGGGDVTVTFGVK